MGTYYPNSLAYVTIGYTDRVFGQIIAPGFIWTTTADAINADDSDVAGRYVDPQKELHGVAKGKRQDTYLSGETPPGGGSFSGRAFTNTGDGSFLYRKNPQTNSWELLWGNAAATDTTTPVLLADAATAYIEAAEIFIGRGWPPVSGSIDVFTPENNYFYVEFASGETINYRLAFEFGNPIALDRTEDGGTTWRRVKQLRGLPSLEKYLELNRHFLRIYVKPMYGAGLTDRLIVEVGSNHFLIDTPTEGVLPDSGRIKVTGRNGWFSFGYYPLRHQLVRVIKPATRPVNNFGAARLAIVNALAPDSNATISTTLNEQEGKLGFQAAVSKPDAGDGKGSADAPRFSDITIIEPAEYSFDLGGGEDAGVGYGIVATQSLKELEVWDDVSRCYHYSALVTADNSDGRYTGSVGRVAANIQVAVDGGTLWQRCLGIGGTQQGLVFTAGVDSLPHALMPVSDRSVQMMVPLNDECLFDNWAWPSIVRFLAKEKGGIHDTFLGNIPLYIPPQGDWQRPYGPAGDDCPYYIPFRGLGGQPMGRFMPWDTPWGILLLLASMMSEVSFVTGLPVPYTVGFDAVGALHFEPRDFAQQPSAITYSSFDTSGVAPILGGIRVFNDVARMRTDLHLQSIDPYTNELLYSYFPMPNAVRRVVGFQHGWAERNMAFGDAANMASVLESMKVTASLPSQSCWFTSVYRPEIHAGYCCDVYDEEALGGLMSGVITHYQTASGLIDPANGAPFEQGMAIVGVRARANLIA